MFMFKQGDTGQKSQKYSYALLASLAAIVIILAALLLPQVLSIPQSSVPLVTPSPPATTPTTTSTSSDHSVTSPTAPSTASTSQVSDPSITPYPTVEPIIVSPGFGLNYSLGDHMVYATTSTATAQQSNLPDLTGTPSTTNSTMSLDVKSYDGQNYGITQTITATIGDQTITPQLNLNVPKTDCYKNLFIGADILLNSSKPAVLAFLDTSTGKVGEVLTIPVSTGNASYGLTGELTLTIRGVQEVTVPAGTFNCVRIDVSSNILNLYADPNYLNAIHIAPFSKSTVQMNGTTYLEQGTFRLIKSSLIQYGTAESVASVGNPITVTSVINYEKTLTEYTKKNNR